MSPPRSTKRSLSRRNLLLFGGAGITTGLLANCSDNNGGATAPTELEDSMRGAMEDFAEGVQFRATEPLDVDLLFCNWPEYSVQSSWTFLDDIAERTNVTVDMQVAPFSDFPARRSLLLGAGDAPMLIPLSYPGDETPFVASGAVLPISEYLDYLPNYRARIEEWGLEADIELLRQEDGRYYLLPSLQESPQPDFTLCVRADVLQEHDIDLPETWDEVREALVALKAAHPELYPFSDRFEGNSSLNYAAVAFGTVGGWGYGNGDYYDADQDAFIYAGASQEYRELVTFFAGLIEDGLMDPESYTQDLDSHDRKVANSDCFFMTGNAIDILTWENGLNETLGEGNYSIVKLKPPAGPKGALIGGGRLGPGVIFSGAISERDDFVALLQFIDWLYFDEEAYELTKWGIEGEMHTKDSDGVRSLTEGYSLNLMGLNPQGETDLLLDLGYSHNVFTPGGSNDLMLSMLNDTEREWVQETLDSHERVPPRPAAPLSEMEREQAAMTATALKDAVEVATLQFILGRRDLSEWDDYVQELESAGSERYLEIINGAYERFEPA